MNNWFTQLKKALKKIRNFLPSPIPKGLPEFQQWCDDIIDTYDAPNNDSVRWALANMILQIGPQTSYRSKRFFGRSLDKGAANEVAYYYMQEVKKKQAELKAAAEQKAKQEQLDKQPSEATGNNVVALDGQKQ